MHRALLASLALVLAGCVGQGVYCDGFTPRCELGGDAGDVEAFAVCGDRWVVQCGGGVITQGAALCLDDGTASCDERGALHCVEVVCDGTRHVGPGGEP